MFKILCLFALFMFTKAMFNIGIMSLSVKIETTSQLTMERSFQRYKQKFYKSKDKISGVDLVVFPEYGLTGLHPNVEESAQFIPDVDVEIGQYENYIKKLSDLAKTYRVGLAVNMLEYVNTISGKTYYNALVVFDKNGRLIKKARKIVLSPWEWNSNITPGNNITTFVFEGHRIALVIGDDIFRTAYEITSVYKVIVSASWNDQNTKLQLHDKIKRFQESTNSSVYISNFFPMPINMNPNYQEYTQTYRDVYLHDPLTEYNKSINFWTPGESKVLIKPALNATKLSELYNCQLFTDTYLSPYYNFRMDLLIRENIFDYECVLERKPNITNLRLTLENVRIVVGVKPNDDILILPIMMNVNESSTNYKFYKNETVSIQLNNEVNVVKFGINVLNGAY